LVAIPALLVHTILSSKINSIISDIDQYSVKLINLLSAAQKAGTRGQKKVDEEDEARAND
jgi:biopolymer transport protein ExbB/TolQ